MKYSKFKVSGESLGFLFWQVANLWQQQIKNALKSCDITHTQYVIMTVIHYLREENKHITQKDISEISKIDVMTLSTTLRLLEKKGLVSRNNHPTDTRAKQVSNTDLGESILKKAVPLVECVDEKFFFDEQQDINAFTNFLLSLKEKHEEIGD